MGTPQIIILYVSATVQYQLVFKIIKHHSVHNIVMLPELVHADFFHKESRSKNYILGVS
jgi:hypothetical protein